MSPMDLGTFDFDGGNHVCLKNIFIYARDVGVSIFHVYPIHTCVLRGFVLNVRPMRKECHFLTSLIGGSDLYGM